MSYLEEFAKRTRNTRGLLHQRNLGVLRNYLGTTPEDQLIEAIEKFTDIELLKTLWEAGLKLRLQEPVLRRYTELSTRRAV